MGLPVQRFQGVSEFEFARFENDCVILSVSGAPVDGTSGTGAGLAGPGSICLSTSGQSYTNTNTKASPTWTANT